MFLHKIYVRKHAKYDTFRGYFIAQSGHKRIFFEY